MTSTCSQVGIVDVVDADDLVATLNSGFLSRSVGIDPSDDGRLIEDGGVFVVHHVHAGQQADGEQDVHGRSGEGDDEALPARMGQEFAGISGAIVHRVFARHFDVAAERKALMR